MQISYININEIKQAQRFDAEYFKPEYKKIENKINNIKNDYLYNLAENKYKNYKPKYKNEYFYYIEISKINLITGEYEFEKILNSNQPSRAQKICNQFDLLISTVRPIRNAVTLILESKNNLIASTGFCKLSNIKVNPYYLFALFKTNIFIKLLDRKTTATQYPAVNENDILNLRIPLLSNSFQSQIETSVKQAYAKQEQSKKLYHEAEEILLKELNLLEFTPTQFLTFSTSVKNIQLVGRFDAEYFQPKYTQIENKIKNYKGGYDIIKNIFNLKKGVEVGADAYLENQEGKGFYRVADISPNSIRLTDKKISNELFYKLKNDFQPKIGDILFTKDGTIGISYLVNENIEGIVSSAFLRLTLKKQFEHFNKETLTLILNSPLCKLQCEKLSGGALIEHLKPSDFEKFFIPIIQKSVQNQIQQRVQESYILKNQAEILLQQAIKMVEKEIEK